MQAHAELKQEDEIMKDARQTSDEYCWSSTTVEDKSREPQATWGVAFNYRPNLYQLAAPGLFWKKLRKTRYVKYGSIDIPNEDAFHGAIENSVAVETYSNKAWRHLFATVGRNSVRVYWAERGRPPKLVREFVDASREETFYAVTWTYNADGRHSWWVIAGGERGIIRVLDVSSRAVVRTLVGHGASVNGLAVHPRDSALIVSASKDESIRMWNLRTGTMVAVFAGIKGHRGEVIGVDFDRTGTKLASCGLDYSIRVWDIMEDEQLFQAIVASHQVADIGTDDPYMFRDFKGTRHKIKFQISQFPAFVSRKPHKNYVDCVKWCGDLLITKSIHDRILVWEPILNREVLAAPATEYEVIDEFYVTGCKVWFIRFALDPTCRIVAIGNQNGGLSIQRIDDPISQPKTVNPPVVQKFMLAPVAQHACWVRQCAFSHDASIVVSVDDNSRVVQYDRVQLGSVPHVDEHVATTGISAFP